MIRYIVLVLFILIACEDVNRDWDNPYDPRSNRALWTPDSLNAQNISVGKVELSWIRKGRDFDGFIIDKKVGDEDWKNSLIRLNDLTFQWVDTLDLKDVVNDNIKSANKVEYQYRIYAYAIMENGDTNVSNFSPGIIEPDAPSQPDTLKILSIKYIFPKKMTVEWGKSTKNFKSYEIYHSFFNDFSNKTLYKTLYNSNTVSLDTANFTVLKENWFWVGVVDSMGQKTILNNSVGWIPIDLPPESVILDSITFQNDKFNFKWSKANMNAVVDDFSSYIIEEMILPDSSFTNIKSIDLINDIEESIGIEKDNEKYYRIKLNDHWGNSSVSNILPASSFQKIIIVDFIRDFGDDVSIFNMGSTLLFPQKITNINAKFPVWIQNGKKIFALIEGDMGIVLDEDGSGLRKIIGQEPQDISFNNDQTKAVYSGEDHNLYYVDLTKNEGEITIQNQNNNEWFSDPEIISNDEILYTQIKNPYLNNLGPQGIFTSGLDGNNVKTILFTNPANKSLKGARYLMPRMSPLKDKILYVNEDESLYVLELDANRNIVSNNILRIEGVDNVLPEESKYFRNIRWSPGGTKAVFWTKEVDYNLYIYDSINTPSIVKLLQPGARYADWITEDKVLFRFENVESMFTKNINEPPTASPMPLINESHPAFKAPWAQLQPRQ